MAKLTPDIFFLITENVFKLKKWEADWTITSLSLESDLGIFYNRFLHFFTLIKTIIMFQRSSNEDKHKINDDC